MKSQHNFFSFIKEKVWYHQASCPPLYRYPKIPAPMEAQLSAMISWRCHSKPSVWESGCHYTSMTVRGVPTDSFADHNDKNAVRRFWPLLSKPGEVLSPSDLRQLESVEGSRTKGKSQILRLSMTWLFMSRGLPLLSPHVAIALCSSTISATMLTLERTAYSTLLTENIDEIRAGIAISPSFPNPSPPWLTRSVTGSHDLSPSDTLGALMNKSEQSKHLSCWQAKEDLSTPFNLDRSKIHVEWISARILSLQCTIYLKVFHPRWSLQQLFRPVAKRSKLVNV